MVSKRLHHFAVYVDDKAAAFIRASAQRQQISCSAYLKQLVLVEQYGETRAHEKIERDLHYLKISADAVMDEVQLLRLPPDKIPYRSYADDSLRTIVTRVHKARMAEASDAD